MRIGCPHCGERDLREFSYLGDASVQRPDPQALDALGHFTAYVYFRDNPAGPIRLWYHGLPGLARAHPRYAQSRDLRVESSSHGRSASAPAALRHECAGSYPRGHRAPGGPQPRRLKSGGLIDRSPATRAL
jgi:sarcosine oxidase subunit delta